MKYVFSIASHLTFFIAKRIMESMCLDYNDCVLLLVRDYYIPSKEDGLFENQIHTSYNVDTDNGRIFAGVNFVRTNINIKQFDRKVDAYLQGNDFIWFTTVCSNDICSLMVTKPNCMGYYIYEDGLASYRDYNPTTFIGWRAVLYKYILCVLWPRLFKVKNHFIETNHPKFKGCIATNEDCFPLHRDYLIIVGNPFEKCDYHGIIPDAIISVDPLYQFIPIAEVDKIYQKLSAFMANNKYKTIAYKLHPRFNATTNSHRKEYLNLIDKYFSNAIKLDADIVLENLLLTYKIDFYSCNSTVALYASTYGSTCYNIVPMLKGTKGFEDIPIMRKRTIYIG